MNLEDNVLIKFPIIVLLFFVCFSVANAQGSLIFENDGRNSNFTADLILEKSVKSHKQIDEIYGTFSEGYRTLKPEMVANLYTEDAVYLSPNNSITNGRQLILENFTGFFNSIKNNGQTMTISFQIFQRRVEKNMGYDVGIYTISFYKDGKMIDESKGKFVVVAVREKDKKWRFQVDGYSSLTPPQKN